jgi:hypothetical protein
MYFIKRRGLSRACLAVRPVSAQRICRTVLELRLSPRQEDAYPMGKYLLFLQQRFIVFAY